jgi:hypothetical protein
MPQPQHNTALKAAQGIDTLDLLNHIAWTDVILPKLLEAKDGLTKRLVNATLNVPNPKEETREQLAGKLFGIDHFIHILERILSEGGHAKELLAKQNLFLQ